jgi:hypothetical protein
MGKKKLSPADAFTAWTKLNKLTYTVTGKFEDDHIMAVNLSKKNSIAAALVRYKKNQAILRSSWLALDKTTVLNKATASTSKRASVHQAAQQLTVGIKVNRRTVTIEPLTKQESSQYEHVVVEINGAKHYLNCSSAEQEIVLLIIGPWDPLTGKVQLYHYQEGAMPGSHTLLDKFLEWNVDDENNPISPTAKK